MLIPLVVKLLSFRRELTAQTIVDFRIFQVYQSIVRGFLLLVGQRDWDAEASRLRDRDKENIGWHMAATYGNLERLLYLSSQITKDKIGFQDRIRSLPREAFLEYQQTAERCIVEIDRLAPWINSSRQGVADVHAAYMLARILRDQLAEVTGVANLRDPARTGHEFYNSLLTFLPLMLEHITSDFSSRRRLIDRSAKLQHAGGMVFLATRLLYTLAMRPLLRSWSRFRGTAYIDYWSTSLYVDALREWRKQKGWTKEQAARHLGLNTKTYNDYEMGYEVPELGVIREPLAFWIDINMSK
jgi:hypothetical protein